MFPVVIQCNTSSVAQQVADLLQPLVDRYFSLSPSDFMETVSRMENWQRVCTLLDSLDLEYYVLLRAHRIGIFMSRYAHCICNLWML